MHLIVSRWRLNVSVKDVRSRGFNKLRKKLSSANKPKNMNSISARFKYKKNRCDAKEKKKRHILEKCSASSMKRRCSSVGKMT